MKKETSKQIEAFDIYNDIALQNELVVYGSDYTADFPFYELSRRCLLRHALYNRSIRGMTLEEAIEGLHKCVLRLHPQKVLLHFGENEEAASIDTYRRLLTELRQRLPHADVYVLPLRGTDENTVAYNRALSALCGEMGATFLQIRYRSAAGELSYARVFNQFIRFFRSEPLSMVQAFRLT